MQRCPSSVARGVDINVDTLNKVLDDIKVSIPGIRNQYSPHSVHISKLLMYSVAIMTTFYTL